MKMKKFAFISRHTPTEGQLALAQQQGIELIPIGDLDAFTVDITDIKALEEQYGYHFDGVVVVHPAAALRLALDYPIGVFENANRAPEGEKPRFEAKTLRIYNIIDWLQQRGWL